MHVWGIWLGVVCITLCKILAMIFLCCVY